MTLEIISTVALGFGAAVIFFWRKLNGREDYGFKMEGGSGVGYDSIEEAVDAAAIMADEAVEE